MILDSRKEVFARFAFWAFFIARVIMSYFSLVLVVLRGTGGEMRGGGGGCMYSTHINTNRPPLLADLLRSKKDINSGATAKVEDRFAFFDICQSDWVSAA